MAEDDELWPQPDRVGRQVENLKEEKATYYEENLKPTFFLHWKNFLPGA